MDDDEDIVCHVIGLGGGEPRWSEYSGTKALMLAVLEGGIDDYCVRYEQVHRVVEQLSATGFH